MATAKGLNPQAPEYIPLSSYHTTLPYYIDFSPLLIHSQPLYTSSSSSSSYPLHPPHPNSFPPTPPPPSVVVDPPRAVVNESVGNRAPWRPRGFGTRDGFCRRGGFRQGFVHQYPKEVTNRVWRPRSSTNVHQSSYFLKKHQVLPLRNGDEEKTTVMIKNIPKEYNFELLLKFLDEHCLLENQKNMLEDSEKAEVNSVTSAYDFMYMPIDFKTGHSRGFAFVNFTEARAVWKFYNVCNRKKWDLFQSPKIREIVWAMIQGKEALVKHFERSTFWCESDEFLPVCFSPARDGSGLFVKQDRIGRRVPT